MTLGQPFLCHLVQRFGLCGESFLTWALEPCAWNLQARGSHSPSA